jgi:hypothetical protein
MRAELSAIKQDFVQMHSSQDKFASLLGGMQSSLATLSSQVTAMTESLNAHNSFRPSSSTVPPHHPPATQPNPCARSPADTSLEPNVQLQLSKEQQLSKQCEFTAQQRPPPINTNLPLNPPPRSAPPGFGHKHNPDGEEIQVTGSPHSAPTPAFHYFQPPAVRRGWEGFIRTYEQEQHMQFLKALTKGPRMDFPCFDGTNPGGWIRECDKYFQLAGAPEEYKVSLAQLYFIDSADVWLRRSKLLKKNVCLGLNSALKFCTVFCQLARMISLNGLIRSSNILSLWLNIQTNLKHSWQTCKMRTTTLLKLGLLDVMLMAFANKSSTSCAPCILHLLQKLTGLQLTWNRLVQLSNLPASSVTQDSPNSLIPTETRPQLTGQLTTKGIQPI